MASSHPRLIATSQLLNQVSERLAQQARAGIYQVLEVSLSSEADGLSIMLRLDPIINDVVAQIHDNFKHTFAKRLLPEVHKLLPPLSSSRAAENDVDDILSLCMLQSRGDKDAQQQLDNFLSPSLLSSALHSPQATDQFGYVQEPYQLDLNFDLLSLQDPTAHMGNGSSLASSLGSGLGSNAGHHMQQHQQMLNLQTSLQMQGALQNPLQASMQQHQQFQRQSQTSFQAFGHASPYATPVPMFAGAPGPDPSHSVHSHAGHASSHQQGSNVNSTAQHLFANGAAEAHLLAQQHQQAYRGVENGAAYNNGVPTSYAEARQQFNLAQAAGLEQAYPGMSSYMQDPPRSINSPISPPNMAGSPGDVAARLASLPGYDGAAVVTAQLDLSPAAAATAASAQQRQRTPGRLSPLEQHRKGLQSPAGASKPPTHPGTPSGSTSASTSPPLSAGSAKAAPMSMAAKLQQVAAKPAPPASTPSKPKAAAVKLPDMPGRFKVLPPQVAVRVHQLTKDNHVVMLKDFDEKVISKMGILVDKFGTQECLAMLERIEEVLKGKAGRLANGPGYLDVSVSTRIDELKQRAAGQVTAPEDFARSTLHNRVYTELKDMIEGHAFLSWEHFDHGIIIMLKKMPNNLALERLSELAYHTFKNVENVKSCIVSIFTTKPKYVNV